MEENYIQNQQTNSIDKSDSWELYEATVFGYRVDEEKMEFARRPNTLWQNQMDLTGIPGQFRDAYLDNFDFKLYHAKTEKLEAICQSFVKEFEKWQKLGCGVFIWSQTPGSGKTFLSCCLANSVLVRNSLRVRFITSPDYIATVGESYKRERGAEDRSEIFRNCDLLVLDDVGAQKDGEWQRQELFRLVNQRTDDRKLPIFTSNFPPEKLNLDNRTIDRIITKSAVISLPEEPIRRRKASAEQQVLLNSILNGE